MQSHRFFVALGAGTLLATASCGGGKSTGPNNETLDVQISTDLANNAAQAVVTDYTDLSGGDGVGGAYAVVLRPLGVAYSVSTLAASTSCTQSGVNGDLRYYCPADTVIFAGSSQTDTVVRERNYEFFAAGAAQASFTTSTDSINFGGTNGVPIYLALHSSQSTAVSHRVRRYAVTDENPSFASDTVRTWNGTTAAADTGSYSASPYNVSFTGTATDALVNVVYLHPASRYPYPITGRFQRTAHWVYSYTGASSGSGSVNRTVIVTFDGTKNPTVQVTGGTTLTCKVDLTNSNVSNCH